MICASVSYPPVSNLTPGSASFGEYHIITSEPIGQSDSGLRSLQSVQS